MGTESLSMMARDSAIKALMPRPRAVLNWLGLWGTYGRPVVVRTMSRLT